MKRSPYVTIISILSFFVVSLLIYSTSWGVGVRAVSIKVLQERLKVCQKEGLCPEELLQLAGLKRVMGYLIDKAHNDLILFGPTDPDLPPLYVEDFVIALRNTWLKYAYFKGNVRYYSDPGCSIDPNPQTIQRLEAIGKKILRPSSFGQVEEAIKNWRGICKELQSVRVMGIPFDTRFARIMVKADYDMKSLVDGSDSLDIPGLKSLTGMKLNEIRTAILQNKPIMVSHAGMNRFWFYPSPNIYEEDQGIILIKQCPVRLLTEKTFVSARGNYISGNATNPLAQKFAEDFSILYSKVSRERPIYAELENLFRFVVLVKIIKFKSSHRQVGLALNYLLEDFTIAENPVDRRLPGRSAVKEFRHRQEVPGGYEVFQLWLPSCGGVSIAIQAKPKQFRKNISGLLANLKADLLNARPSTSNLYWDFQDKPDGHLASVQNSFRVQGINWLNKNSSVVTVVDKKSGYHVYGGENDPIYEGNNIPELVEAINDQMGSKLKQTVYLDMKGFPPHKIKAFATTCSIKESKGKTNISVKTFPRKDGTTRLQDAFFSQGIQFRKESSSLEPVTQGQFKGRYRVTLNFITKIGGKIRHLTVYVFAKTKELAQQFLQRVISDFSAQDCDSCSVSDKINRIRQELQKEKKDFEIKIKDEVGNSEIVLFRKPRRGKVA